MTPPQKTTTRAYPVEEFLQALTAQLDRAQDLLAAKVTGTSRPLTWALKDLSIDLRVFVDVNSAGRVTLRSAAPNEEGASTIHLSLTTITRAMVEENSVAFHPDSDLRPVEQIGELANLDEEDQRKLDWMGIRTAGQLKRLNPEMMQAATGLPIGRLQAALEASARPMVASVEAMALADGSPGLRIRGANLTHVPGPEVKLRGDPVEVLSSAQGSIVVRPQPHHLGSEGPVEVHVKGQRTTGYFRLAPATYGESPSIVGVSS